MLDRKARNPEQSCPIPSLILMVLETVLVIRLAYMKIICTCSSVLYYISCHVVAYELDVSRLISLTDYEKTTSTFVTLPDGALLEMI